MVTIILRILGNIFLTLSILFISCDNIHYLTLRTSDTNLTNHRSDKRDFLVYSSDSLKIKITSLMLGRPLTKKKKGAVVFLTVLLESERDLRFDPLETFLVDNKDQKIYAHPTRSRGINKDNLYIKSTDYEIILEFLRPSGIFQMPLEIHLPVIIFVESKSELNFGKITME